jgi:hypothetical protein
MSIAGIEGEFFYSNGRVVNGWVVAELERCDSCNSQLIYSEDYDALFCGSCNHWVESAHCSDPSCDYCHGRPEQPLSELIP